MFAISTSVLPVTRFFVPRRILLSASCRAGLRCCTTTKYVCIRTDGTETSKRDRPRRRAVVREPRDQLPEEGRSRRCLVGQRTSGMKPLEWYVGNRHYRGRPEACSLFIVSPKFSWHAIMTLQPARDMVQTLLSFMNFSELSSKLRGTVSCESAAAVSCQGYAPLRYACGRTCFLRSTKKGSLVPFFFLNFRFSVP